MSRPRVLFLIPNLQQGGAERQILALMRRLSGAFETSLCLFDDSVHYRAGLPQGQPKYVLQAPKMGRVGLQRLIGVLEQERPHVLQCYRDRANFWGRLAVRTAPVPVVLTSVRNRALDLRNLLTERWFSGWTDRVLTNSEGIRKELQLWARVPAEKISVVHNFIDLEEFSPPDDEQRRKARLRRGVDDGETALLLPGRITPQKHQLGLAFALRRLAEVGRLRDDLVVLLAGRRRSPLYAGLLDRCLRWFGLAKRVRTVGVVSDREMPSLYHAADALVLPSLYEGLPNASLEAHACALPAIVSFAANIDGIVIDGQTGFEVPTYDTDALADAIGNVNEMSTEERRRWGARGRAHVATKFDVDRITQEVMGLYQELLARKGIRC